MALYALLVVHAREGEDLELNSVALWDDQVVSGKGSGDATGGSCGHVPVGRGSDLSPDESSPWVGGCSSSSSSSSSARAVVRAVPVRRGPACPTPGGPPSPPPPAAPVIDLDRPAAATSPPPPPPHWSGAADLGPPTGRDSASKPGV